jgi:putative transposase
MTMYRRNFVDGGSFFFTVSLAQRRLRLLTDHVDLLREAFRCARRRHPFAIEGIVILPEG